MSINGYPALSFGQQNPPAKMSKSGKVNLDKPADRFSANPIVSKQLYDNANSFIRSLPLKSMQHPLQLIELGSRMVRVLIIPGQLGQIKTPYFANYPSPLGDSLEKNQGLISEEAVQKLVDTFKQLKWDLPEGVNLKQFACFATSGLRDAKNREAVVKTLKARANLPHIDVLTPQREASLSYIGTLRNIKNATLQKNVVIDIGSGSIQLALGTGNTAVEPDMNLALPVGSNRIRLDNPFDPLGVNMSKLYVSEMLKSLLPGHVASAASGRIAYLNESRIFKTLQRIHQQQFGKPLLDAEGGMNRDIVNYYLSAEGLASLKKAYDQDGTLHDDLIRTIPRKLIVLSVLMDKLGLSQVRFGAGSCLRAGYCVEAAEDQLKKTLAPMANQLAKTYQTALPAAVTDFKAIFPDFDENFTARAKTSTSILDKLVKLALDPNTQLNLHDPRDARDAVQDGIGIRTRQLPYTREQFVSQLSRLISEKGYIPRRYTNYEGENGLLYLDTDTLDKHFAPQPNKANKVARIKEVIKRPNNYTTTQLYFQPAGVTDYCVELQIRGPEVNSVGDAEHMYYNLRRRKNMTHGLPELQNIVAPVDAAINGLNREQTRLYEQYLAQCYKAARLREQEKDAFYPPLPEGINPVLEINHLRMVKERLAVTEKKLASAKQ